MLPVTQFEVDRCLPEVLVHLPSFGIVPGKCDRDRHDFAATPRAASMSQIAADSRPAFRYTAGPDPPCEGVTLMPAARCLVVLAWLSVLPASVPAREPFRFPEGKSGKAELKVLNLLPVLVVEGEPA